jgi:Integrase core domain
MNCSTSSRICVSTGGELDLVDETTGELLRTVPAPIAVVSDNGPCFRGQTYAAAFAGEDPLLRHVCTRVRSPQTSGVIERFFGTLKYEHLFRGRIDDGDALAVEINRFRQIYNTIRPHQALDDRTPRDATSPEVDATSEPLATVRAWSSVNGSSASIPPSGAMRICRPGVRGPRPLPPTRPGRKGWCCRSRPSSRCGAPTCTPPRCGSRRSTAPTAPGPSDRPTRRSPSWPGS